MHPYLPHLLSDILAANRTEIPKVTVEKISFEEEMEDIERWLEQEERWLEQEEAEHTFGYYCGLEAFSFPPANQLTKKEMKLVIKAFLHMMFTWNSGIEMPENFPIALKYSFLVNTLNEKTAIVNSGFMTFDYCSGYAPDCVFKEYCSCLKYYNESNEDDMDVFSLDDSNDLPF